MEIIGRAAAKAAGLKTYYTGEPCKKGHFSYRYVASGGCAECINGVRSTDLRRSGLTDAERDAESKLRASLSSQEQERLNEARSRREAEIAEAAKQHQLRIQINEKRDIGRLHLRNHWILESNIDRWMKIRDVAICLSQIRCPELYPNDIDQRSLEDSARHKLKLHPEDIVAVKEFQESLYELTVEQVREWGNWSGADFVKHTWFSCDAVSSPYQYVYILGAWYLRSEVLECGAGRLASIRRRLAGCDTPKWGCVMTGV